MSKEDVSFLGLQSGHLMGDSMHDLQVSARYPKPEWEGNFTMTTINLRLFSLRSWLPFQKAAGNSIRILSIPDFASMRAIEPENTSMPDLTDFLFVSTLDIHTRTCS